MNKKTLTLLTLIILTLSIATPIVSAKKDDNPGNHYAKGKTDKPAASNGLNNEKSPVEHLYLYEKDPDTWDIVDDGAWAKLTILTHKDKYIFNAHDLEPGIDYSLINYAPETDWDENPYPNPWPGEGSREIDVGTTNEDGNIHLKGDWVGTIIGKIWLVLSEDFGDDPAKMIDWAPAEYLFEYDLINSLD